LGTIEEIEKFAKDKYGSVEAAWKNRYQNEAPATPKPIEKRASDIAYERIERIAKNMGKSVEQLLTESPELYNAYLKISDDVVVGAKVF